MAVQVGSGASGQERTRPCLYPVLRVAASFLRLGVCGLSRTYAPPRAPPHPGSLRSHSHPSLFSTVYVSSHLWPLFPH